MELKIALALLIPIGFLIAAALLVLIVKALVRRW